LRGSVSIRRESSLQTYPSFGVSGYGLISTVMFTSAETFDTAESRFVWIGFVLRLLCPLARRSPLLFLGVLFLFY
jgi:hypothetical protein